MQFQMYKIWTDKTLIWITIQIRHLKYAVVYDIVHVFLTVHKICIAAYQDCTKT